MKKCFLGFILAHFIAQPLSAQWQNMGPLAGSVKCFLSINQTIYCGLSKLPYGIFKSEDSGKSWTSMGGPTAEITKMFTWGGSIYANNFTSDRIYRSNISNINWLYGRCSGATKIQDICFLHDTLYAATDAGIYRSIDSGKTWGTPLITGNYYSIISFQNLLFASRPNSIDKSVDFGKSWQSCHNQSVRNLYTDNVAVFCALNASPLGVLRTMDSGSKWENFTTGLPGTAFPLAFTKLNNQYFLLTYDAVFASADTGKSWTKQGNIGYVYNGGDLFAFKNALYSCYPSTDLSGGIYKSVDLGKNWSHIGLPIYRVLTLGSFKDTLNFAGELTGYTKDRGKTWVIGDYGPSTPYQFHFYNNKLFLSGSNSLLVSDNRGKTYSKLINARIYDMAWLGNKYFATSGLETFIMNLDGSGQKSIPQLNGKILASIIAHNGNIFASSRLYIDSSYYSTDSGKSWKKHPDTLFTGLTAFDIVNGVIYAGVVSKANQYYFIKSDDGGFHWTKIQSNYPNDQINTIKSKNGVLYAGGFAGLHVSMDLGKTWINANDGFPYNPFPIYSIAVDDSFFYVTGIYGGIYRGNPILKADLPLLKNKKSNAVIAYPNPANQTLYLKAPFALDDQTAIHCFDISGNLIFKGNANEFKKSDDQILLSLHGLKSGIYCIQIITPLQIFKQLIVVKNED